MPYLNTPYIQTSFDHELGAVIAIWHGYVEKDEAKAGFQNMYELFRETEAKFVLADLRDYEGGFGTITEWLTDEYMPKMIAAGYMASANVVPEEFLAYVSLNDFEDKQAGVVPLRVFASFEEAKLWIESLSLAKITRTSLKAVA